MRKPSTDAQLHGRINRRVPRFSREDVAVSHGSYLVSTPEGRKYRRTKHTWHGVNREDHYGDGMYEQHKLDKESLKFRGYDYDY